MSWFSKNFEKATLGGAAIIALVLIYFGWSRFSGVEADFGDAAGAGGGKNTAVAGAELIPKALQSMQLDRTWKQELAGTRPVDLFTGIALFIKSSDPEKPIDLLKDAPVHEPIPNTFWLEYRLDPGFADSPNRDPDGDGFSNLEEYQAKTHPNDSKVFPNLVAKLMYIKDESLAWVIRPGYPEGDKVPFSYEDSKRQTNKVPPGEGIAPDEMFFKKGVMENRFKFLGSEVRKEMSERTHSEEEITYTRIEDQRPNKKGTLYQIPAPLSEQRKTEYLQYDRTAVFSLEAVGQGGREFKIEENTLFALPPDAPQKAYLLKKVTPTSVTLEFSDSEGKRQTLDINKGSLPQIGQ